MMSLMRPSLLRPALTVLAAAVAAPAWAANKDIERLYVQVAALQSQVADLQRTSEESLKEIRRMNELLADQAAQVRKGAQDRRVQDEALQSALKDLTERLAELGERMDSLRASAAPPQVYTPSTGAAGPTGPTGPGATPAGPGMAAPGGAAPPPAANVPPARELYTQAYADYARGNYDLAIQEWQEYLKNYGSTEFADNAQYWIGKSLYSKQKFAEAIDAWNELFRTFPSSDKLPDARLEKGMALERLGRRREALAEYRYVADRYPNSDAGRKARERLNP
jgi:tol-pal system protein YbgF